MEDLQPHLMAMRISLFLASELIVGWKILRWFFLMASVNSESEAIGG